MTNDEGIHHRGRFETKFLFPDASSVSSSRGCYRISTWQWWRKRELVSDINRIKERIDQTFCSTFSAGKETKHIKLFKKTVLFYYISRILEKIRTVLSKKNTGANISDI